MIMIKPLPVTVNRQRGARIHLVFQGGCTVMDTSMKHFFSSPDSKIRKRFPAGLVLAAVLFTVLLRTSLGACYAAAAESNRYGWEEAPAPEEYDEVVAIVHTNDVHGFIEHEPYVKGFADQLKAGGKYDLVLTVSG